MTEWTRTLRKTPRCGRRRRLAALAILLVCAASPAAAESWTDQTDAITKLWGGRLNNSAPWPVASCDNFNALSARVHEVTTDTQSGLVVPQLTFRNQRLTDNVAAMARALLNTDLTSPAQNTFLPTDTNADGPIVMNDQFWAANLRSSHADESHRLPAPGGALPDPPQNCPAGLGALGRLQTLRALNSAPVNVNLTNRVKWHCYANRYRMVGDNDVGIPGFVEVTHFEFNGQASQYSYAESRGRFVFDYVNRRLYYTPAHYHTWYKANFNPVGDVDHPAANTVCNPFFEIVR